MITRRSLVLTSLLVAIEAPLARTEPASSDDPVAIVTAIYTRVAKGKGDGGGAFVIENKAAKAKYLSKALVALWAKADAHTPKGDVGPIDFDPVTNSQDPDVKSFKVDTEKLEADKASIAVTLDGHRGKRPRSRPMPSSIMISFASRPDGRSTTSRVSAMAKHGRSAPCSPTP